MKPKRPTYRQMVEKFLDEPNNVLFVYEAIQRFAKETMQTPMPETDGFKRSSLMLRQDIAADWITFVKVNS